MLDYPLLCVEQALLEHVLGDGGVPWAVGIEPYVEVHTGARAVLLEYLLGLAAVVEPYRIVRGRALVAA